MHVRTFKIRHPFREKSNQIKSTGMKWNQHEIPCFDMIHSFSNWIKCSFQSIPCKRLKAVEWIFLNWGDIVNVICIRLKKFVNNYFNLKYDIVQVAHRTLLPGATLCNRVYFFSLLSICRLPFREFYVLVWYQLTIFRPSNWCVLFGNLNVSHPTKSSPSRLENKLKARHVFDSKWPIKKSMIKIAWPYRQIKIEENLSLFSPSMEIYV